MCITNYNAIFLGLFKRAIGESGSVLAEWALDRDGRGKVASVKIAEIAGCPVEPYQELLTCVQNVDAKVLTQAYMEYAVGLKMIRFIREPSSY